MKSQTHQFHVQLRTGLISQFRSEKIYTSLFSSEAPGSCSGRPTFSAEEGAGTKVSPLGWGCFLPETVSVFVRSRTFRFVETVFQRTEVWSKFNGNFHFKSVFVG